MSWPACIKVAGCLLLMAVPAAAQFEGRKIILDAGHGGADPGAVGIDGGAYPNEEDFVLDVVLRLKAKLEAAGCEVLLTRSTDTAVSLTARRDLANNENPDLFISIHCNSFSEASANGTETFWWTSGNAADQALAQDVQSRMIEAYPLTNRGVKTGNFTVTTCNPPACLAEMMFISNQAEFDLMNSAATREGEATAFYKACADFLGINLNAPVITQSPATVTVNAGQTAAFSVAATGGGLTYQWRRNGVNLSNGGRFSGVTSPNLTITGVTLADAGFYTARVTGGGQSVDSAEGQLVVSTASGGAGTGTGLRGTFYDNVDFTALRRARVDAGINFAWGAGAPSSTMQPDTFSARWTGQVEPRYSQTYTFYTRTDDGVRLWVNGVALIDRWQDQGAVEWSGSIALTAGTRYELRMDYFENAGDATAELRWSSPSQVKEIIPSSRLYRPPVVIAPQADVQVLQGGSLAVTMSATALDPLLSSQPWADFENETDGATDSVLFRKPHHSGSTNAFTDAAKTRETTVVAAMPAGNTSARALHVKWSWAGANPWLRLTTADAATLPNPVVDFRKALRFDVWSEHTLKFALGLRETNSSGAIASNGGLTGPIEFVGVNAMNGSQPVPGRTLVPDVWHTVTFDLPAEPLRGFTGNGVLESTTGLGVLEHLVIAPGSASVDHDVYLDNFVVVENNRLTWSLVSAPSGAVINPVTGLVTWMPTAAQWGTAPVFIVQATDGGSPAVTSQRSFTVRAVPQPDITHISRAGAGLSFTWLAAPGARYDVESTTVLGGPWTVITEVTSPGSTASWSGPAASARRFYRARLKP